MLNLSLDDLDSHTRAAIARVAAKQMDIPYMDGLVDAEFDIWNATEGTTALGVLAGLQTMSMPDDAKRLHFGYLLLQEILKRSGHPDLHLHPCQDDLDSVMIWLLCAGRAAREEMMYADPGEMYDLVRNIRRTVLLYGDSLADRRAIQSSN